LSTGSKGVNELGIPLFYKGCPIHRVIAGFMVQGGDYTLRNGKGGESIYGPTFEDEDLRREVDEEGLLVMANKGKNTNSSQFFVTLRPCPHLNGKHVVFGKVVKGQYRRLPFPRRRIEAEVSSTSQNRFRSDSSDE
jgi:peptidyl-prolyl isomerase G (cyclophilin G)